MDNSSEENLAELLTLRKEVTSLGTIRYFNKDNHYHRIHGPAVIWPSGTEFWFKNGERHRLDGPAFIDYEYGHEEWWVNGHPHRLDGPAVIFSNGSEKEWWEYGKCIRREHS